MELKFFGRGAAFNVWEGNNCAYFLEEKKLFLIDCGEDVFKKIIEKKLLEGIEEVYVLLSHMHCDHCGSLGSLGLYCKYVLNMNLKIIVPHHEEYVEQIKTLMFLYGNPHTYDLLYEEELDGLFTSFTSVRYEETSHFKYQLSFSFTFTCEKGDIFYSSDTNTSVNVEHFIATHKNISAIYVEATDLNIPDDVHLYIGEMARCIPQDLYPKVWMMHMRSEACMKEAIKLGFNVVKIG